MESPATWLTPPATLALCGEEVHVWRAGLDLPAGEIERMREVLSELELARATRFRFREDRQRFLAAHGILRHILARYCDQEPAQLEFCSGPSGKPGLEPRSESSELRFNLSHSRAVALFAVAQAREVGIDVELIQPRLAGERIAERFFSSEEVAVLRAQPPELQAEAFFNCWTRKEAYVKAKGGGFSIALDSFAVSLAPGEPARLLSVKDNPEEIEKWFMKALEPGQGYAGALAAEGRGCTVKLWDWRGPPST